MTDTAADKRPGRRRKASKAEAPANLPAAPYRPTEAEARVVERVARRQDEGRAPRYAIDQSKPNVVRTSADHANYAVWQAALCDTFGTGDFSLANEMAGQVMNAVHFKGTSAPINQADWNAAVAMVHGIGPRDAAEAMLAVQMVAAHHAALECMRRAMEQSPSQIDHFQKLSNTATKLLRTFPAQMEALRRYRSKGEQRVVVQHQHVNVSAEQAAVQVNAPANIRGEGVNLISEEQPHATDLAALTYAPMPPMWRENPEGNAVPIASSDRPEAVPDAWRG
ncbi:MAG TPA: hypothetical protein VK196_17955 [Magnetospirillum sp.]|nr:hypothetical protein [Magnetospirillum sp.]